MVYLLFDASAVAHYYIFNNEYEKTLTCLLTKRTSKKAFFYIPSFCIAEVFNIFAKHYYRLKTIDEKKYNEARKAFEKDIHDRQTFYSYDLNRYHNLNTENILPHEHSYNTEFDASGLKPGDDIEEIEKELKKISDRISKHYLSAFDILIIAMAKELSRIINNPKNVIIITKDNRLYDISKAKFNSEFKAIHIKNTPLTEVENIVRGY